MNKELCITVEEMGARLGIGRSLAYELARSSEFPTVRIGRKMLISVSGLERWLDRNTGGYQDEQAG